MTGARRGLLLVGATGVLVSAYIHFFLYFWGGYRGISIDRIAGLDISRSFALNAIAGLVIAELLVMAWWLRRFERVAALFGVLFAIGAIGAYVLARTSGLLGFTENGWSAEAVIAEVAQVTAVVSLVGYLVIAARTPTVADSRY
jgi:hypothetical protein